MKKSDIKFYNDVLINADLEFLKYQIKKRGVNLISDSGLQKLIDDSEAYVTLPADAPVFNTTLKPILVLYSLSDALRMLWMKRKEFGVQLSAMNTGSYAYGVPDVGHDHNFKDFEFEVYSAAYLNEYGVEATLPQNTDGNDIFYKNLEVQCKHPNGLTRDKVDKFLREFQRSLQNRQTYGVFGIALDDYLEFDDDTFPTDPTAYHQVYHTALQNHDTILQEVFDSTLPHCPRVLGVFSVNTYFSFTSSAGLVLNKTSNSVFCQRPNAKAVQEELQIQAYEILSVFNPKPSIRTY